MEYGCWNCIEVENKICNNGNSDDINKQSSEKTDHNRLNFRFPGKVSLQTNKKGDHKKQ